MTRIFISHSHSDEAIAYKLVDFLLEALGLNSREILCTSNPDQGLSFSSSSITDQLKDQLKNSEAMIVLITADSLHSAWIPFEAGSFWTTDKLIIPILGPGLAKDDLPGPLKSFLIIPIEVQNAEDTLNEATNQLAKSLNLQQEVTRKRKYTLQEFIGSLRAWESKYPKTNSVTQEELEEVKRSLQSQLQEKEELEQSLKEEIKRLKIELKESQSLTAQQLKDKERSLQTKIGQLEQKLEETNLHNQQLEEQERSHNEQLQEKEELEQSLKAKIEQLEQKREGARLQNNQKIEEMEPNIKSEIEQQLNPSSQLMGKELHATILEQLKEINQKLVQAQSFTEDLGNGITLEMIAIPGGKFMMGSPEEEGKDNEKPQHEVTVQLFLMGKYPITQAQYEKVMGGNPSNFEGNDLPVECVSWNDAVEFCQRLSKQTGKEYRLPTEAEWEYACRATTITPYYFGDNITDELVNYGRNIGETTVVGKYPPNNFGLYDMHGNVQEWCQDDWHDNYDGAPQDGNAWLSTESNPKVIRGGAWSKDANRCRSANRYLNYPEDAQYTIIGFRVVCRVPRT